MSVITRKELESQMSPLEAQNHLHQLTHDSLAAGYKVVRVMTSVTDTAQRTRRTIEEVRVCVTE